jgi:deoxyribodipyrimidine photo-lyase
MSHSSQYSTAEEPAWLNALSQNHRICVRRGGAPDPKGQAIVYWMQRAQRGIENHALNLAVEIANQLNLPVVCYFAGIANFPNANLRHYVFLQQGLHDVYEDLTKRNVGFVMRRAPNESHLRFFKDVGAAMVVGDENPMRVPESWRVEIARRISVPFWTVDSDVIIPSTLLEKEQYAAYTIRPRLYRMLPEYLVDIPNPSAKIHWEAPSGLHQDNLSEDMTVGWSDLDRGVAPVETIRGGAHAGLKRLEHFVNNILPGYDESRNKPELDGTSALSPYLHYGHVGPQTIALAVERACEANPKLQQARDSFMNELIVWRELAVNFVKYNPHYDSLACAEKWSQASLAEHSRDEREHLYDLSALESSATHDPLWNAAQTQMVVTGWMHNYMRMYWAKKILEWTPDVETAMRYAIYLNDRYQLDGRDPNGYAGIAWSMVGKFDRPWFDRPIFGKIRYMSGNSTGKKFDSARYIRQMATLSKQGQASLW